MYTRETSDKLKEYTRRKYEHQNEQSSLITGLLISVIVAAIMFSEFLRSGFTIHNQEGIVSIIIFVICIVSIAKSKSKFDASRKDEVWEDVAMAQYLEEKIDEIVE